MARTIRNAKIDTRSARAKLLNRREPYWTAISAGCAVGYRSGTKGGTWIARFRGDDGRQYYNALGAADDAREADGLTVFDFRQAQEIARQFFSAKARELSGELVISDGPYTVQKALDAYFHCRIQRGSKGVAADYSAAKVRILPAIGSVEISKLTTKRIRDWHSEVASLRRSREIKLRAIEHAVDSDIVRAHRSTANRTLTILKAALNHAFQEGRINSDEAWRKVRPFREVDVPIVRFLSASECNRLVNGSPPAFRNLVRGALLTGCRYGELARMRSSDFNALAGTVTVRVSKSSKPRHVVLTEEGQTLFAGLTAGRMADQPVFVRDDGKPWGASHQQRPLNAACQRAKIEPAATFHILRHTYASTLAMRGVPMGVIAAQLGHSDTRMTERHYAHLAPSYVADTIRAALPDLGIVESGKVISISG